MSLSLIGNKMNWPALAPSRLFVLLLLFAMALFFRSDSVAQESRTWTSKNGKFQTVGVLVEVKADQLVLKLEDGNTIEVPLASLSTVDQEFVAARNDSNADPIVKMRGEQLGAELEQRIRAFHAGQENSGEVLRVIYFHGSDSQPQADYSARLNRVMLDIQDFYHEWMVKNGFKSAEKMPLELEDGALVIHVVRGADRSSAYDETKQSAMRIRDECIAALRNTVDFDSDYTFIFCGLIEKRNNEYIVSGPNYGLPYDHVRGCSFNSDCEMLDPLSIKDTKSNITHSRDGKVFTESMAEFTSHRIGSIAHELGHALNLPHNGQTKSQESRLGRALMGNGNRTYRQRTWDRKSKGSFISLGHSLLLAAHPLFTGSDKERWAVAKCEMESVEYSMNGRTFEISGVIASDPPPLAVIAYVDPADGTAIRDYDSTTWVGGVGRDGSFSISVEKHLPGTHELRLTVLLANGASEIVATNQYEANKQGKPDLNRLNSLQLVSPIEKLMIAGDEEQASAAAIKMLEKIENSQIKTPELVMAQLNHIVALTQPVEIQDLAAVTGDGVYLSDVNWEKGIVGWGEPLRDRFWINPKKRSEAETGVLLQVGGEFHAKGLYAHAASSFVYKLDGKWSEFESVVGLQSGALGRVKFSVKADGRTLFESDELAGSEIEKVKLDVTGVKSLELVASSTTSTQGHCWTIWASPMLRR